MLKRLHLEPWTARGMGQGQSLEEKKMKLLVRRSFYYVPTGANTRRIHKAIEVAIVGCYFTTLLGKTGSGAREAKVESSSGDREGSRRLCACSSKASEKCI